MRLIGIVLILITLMGGRIVSADENLVIAMAGETNEHTFTIATKLVREISAKMGTPIQLLPMPAKRSTVMLKTGDIHAELSRIASYTELVPTAIRVDEPIIRVPYYVYSSTQKFEVDGWNSLRPYKIVAVSGYAFVKKYMQSHDTYDVGTVESALQFIKLKRADLFVAAPISTETFFESSEFDTEGIYRLEPPVDYLNLYTFFSYKYPEYAKEYHAALVKLKDEGQYQKLFQ